MWKSNRNRRTKSSVNTAAAITDSLESRMLLSATSRLGASLTGAGGVTGTAEFETETEHGRQETSFDVEIYNAAPNTTFAVSVDGVNVGSIRTNRTGKGELEFESHPDRDDVGFPANWPGVNSGSSVQVGTAASGVLRSGSSNGNDNDSNDNDSNDNDSNDNDSNDSDSNDSDSNDSSGHDSDDDGIDDDHDRDHDNDGIDDDHDDNGDESRGVLTGTTGAIGEVEFETEFEHGRIEREFKVEVRGLTPGSVHQVTVDGVAVGSLTVGSRGYGRLKLSDSPDRNEQPFPVNFPTTTGSSVIAVGSELSGTIANSNPATRPTSPDDSNSSEDHLRLNLTSTGTIQGRANYEDSIDGNEEFQVEIWNGVAGAILPVVVDGVTVGQITVNGRGYGQLEFERNEGRAFPANWPGITDGSRVEVGTELSGNFSGTGRIADASTSEYEEAYVLDHSLDLQATSNMFENWAGLGEKWLHGEGGWYYITPDGGLHKWTAGAAELIATVDVSFYDNPELLYDSQADLAASVDDDVARLTAADLDHDLDLESTGNYYEDWGGEGEKWVKGSDGWYFITPDGSLYQWTRGSGLNGELVAGLDSRYHADPTLLTEALSSLTVEEAAYAIDQGLNIRSVPGDFLNWGGRNEKWLRGEGAWYFITEDGGFYAWDGQQTASGRLLTTLTPDYYNDLSLLVAASASNQPSQGSLLDNVFADVTDLLQI